MFAQESVMDIQKLRQEFEKLPDIKGILYGSEFGFNESLNEYYHPDHTNHRLNYAFIMGAWMAWKAQTVPEGFVLVPKEPTDKTIAHMINTPIEVNLLCDHADTFLSEGEAYIAYKAMIGAQEPTND